MTGDPDLSRRTLVRGLAGTSFAAGAAAATSGASRAAAVPLPRTAPRGGAQGSRRAARRARVRSRQRFFGAANVDPVTGAVRRDLVILSWFGCASFALAMNGTVLLLDAWVPRGQHSGYVPTDPDEVTALGPAAILIGHGHFDHAADAAPIASGSGAVVVGTAEHCAQVREQAVGSRVRVRRLGSVDSPPGSTYHFRVGDLGVTAVRHLHSAPSAPDTEDPHAPLVPPPDPSSVLGHPPTPTEVADTASHLPDEEGGCLLYQLRMPGFRLAWNDSAGPLKDEAPEVLDVLRGLPRSDVHVGTIQGFNQPVNGMRDPRMYIEALRSSVFVPCHHDDWGAPGVTTNGGHYRAPLRAELKRMPARRRPRVLFLTDPKDYIRPGRLSFHV
jgi:hypothetical protein